MSPSVLVFQSLGDASKNRAHLGFVLRERIPREILVRLFLATGRVTDTLITERTWAIDGNLSTSIDEMASFISNFPGLSVTVAFDLATAN